MDLWEPNSIKMSFSLCSLLFEAWKDGLTGWKGCGSDVNTGHSYLLNQDLESNLSSLGFPLLILPDVGFPGLHLQKRGQM